MWRRLASPVFEPAASWWGEPFVKLPLIYVLIGTAYIVASSFFFANRLDYSAPILDTELLKGLVFVFVTGAALALLMYRSYSHTRATQSSFRDLVQSLPDAVLVISIPERRIVFVNGACAETFGYSRDELIGQGTEILHVDQEHFRRFHELSTKALENKQTYLGEFEMRRQDGTVFPTSHVVTFLTNISPDRYVVSVVRDESVSFETRRIAEESAARLEILARNLDEIFWIANEDAQLEYLSPAFEKVWGRPAQEMIRNPEIVLEQVHPADRETVASALAQVREGYDIRYRMIRPDGETRWIHGRAIPVRDEAGRLRRIVGISTDISRVVAQQDELRLAQKLRAVGELTGGVAHDFNNLLMVMMGNAEDVSERLRRQGLEDDGLGEIIAASHRARDLTESLLRFSRHQPEQSTRLDINDAVSRTSVFLDRVLGRRVSVATVLTDDECVVMANPTEFETCLMNLLINARDAMPQGGVVQVSTRIEYIGREFSEIAQGNYVILAVADTGQGMSDTVRRRALEPFFTTKAAGSGTGLGLSLVNSFCKSAGGTVRVFSETGKGTILEMLLPCLPGETPDKAGSHRHGLAEAG